jgi:cellulose synthase/poly-beta-1,6-N-acetylglucosamine synthase-like glycosyltransferase
MEISFWLLFLLIGYCYFGYPLLISLFARWFRRAPRKGEYEPTVSVVLSAWNEEDVIKQKIENLLSLDYPSAKMEILVGSDGSTDRTNEIIKQFRDPRLKLMASEQRRGKMVTLNALVKEARHDVLVFTDARQPFESDAVKALVRNFADPQIGCVSGELMFFQKGGGTARGINLYWNYEKFIRRAESDVYSMLGATGAIYAIRKEFYREVPGNIVLDDMYLPLRIIERGYRAVFDSSAKAYDEVADSPQEEYRRKARTLFGNYQIFWVFRGMFNPFKSPIAIQLFSHKFLRVMVPFLMAAIFFINWALTECGSTRPCAHTSFYGRMFVLQTIFYTMAVIGALTRHQRRGILKAVSKLCSVPYVFCLLNFSALIGFARFLGAKQEITWEKARGMEKQKD